MRFPGLPVSRRRHEADIDFIVELMQACGERERDQARNERDAALNRVAELEQAIVEHRMVRRGSDVRHPYPEDDERLWRVLDGHDRQEREHQRSFERMALDYAQNVCVAFCGPGTGKVDPRLVDPCDRHRDESRAVLHKRVEWALRRDDRQERGDEPVTYPDGSGYLMSWEADGDH